MLSGFNLKKLDYKYAKESILIGHSFNNKTIFKDVKSSLLINYLYLILIILIFKIKKYFMIYYLLKTQRMKLVIKKMLKN